MKVAGFTFIRNAIKYDYPVVEAITSVLPVCDEFIVAVGRSDDETLQLIKNINSPKIKIIETVWDDTLREGGQVLADETNKALKAVSADTTWAFYIQADECIHEKYLPAVKEAMLKWKDDRQVEGLLFNYLHFYGSYDYIGDSRKWYRKEIRIIRNNSGITSYRDAQGFRKDGEKLKVKPIDAFVYHYGWVKPPQLQQAKLEVFNRLWHDEEWMKKNIKQANEFDYSQIDSLAQFKDTHPAVMLQRIKNKNWKFTFDHSRKKLSLKSRVLMLIEQTMGWRIGEYKNYRTI